MQGFINLFLSAEPLWPEISEIFTWSLLEILNEYFNNTFKYLQFFVN